MTQPPVKITNQNSILLNDEQNAIIFSLLGRRCYSLSTSIVQLLTATRVEDTHESTNQCHDIAEWTTQFIGVVCLVKDYRIRSYFVKIFDFDKRELIFSINLSTVQLYQILKTHFHLISRDTEWYGLNFASSDEGSHFGQKIETIFSRRRGKSIESIHRNSSLPPKPQTRQRSASLTPLSINLPLDNADADDNNNNNINHLTKSTSSEDYMLETCTTHSHLVISAPFNFRHIQRIEWNSNSAKFEITSPETNANINQVLIPKSRQLKFRHQTPFKQQPELQPTEQLYEDPPPPKPPRVPRLPDEDELDYRNEFFPLSSRAEIAAIFDRNYAQKFGAMNRIFVKSVNLPAPPPRPKLR